VRRSTAVVAIVALFLVGVAVGALGYHSFLVGQMRRPGGFAAWGTRLLASDLKRHLDLTPQQEAEIERILAESRAESVALHREMRPRVRAILDRTHARIGAVLTPPQRAEFERFRKRRHGRLLHLFGG
jgi:Spy/CpxP family protein refolding chaperone